MVGLKVFARRTLMVAAFVSFFGVASVAAHEAAGAAVSLGSYAIPR
jgi:hypothetical protein